MLIADSSVFTVHLVSALLCRMRHLSAGKCVFLYEKAFSRGQILAVWILAAKLPNSDLNFAVDFWVDFFRLFLPRQKA